MELVDGILQTLGEGMGGSFSVGGKSGAWEGKFYSVKTPTNNSNNNSNISSGKTSGNNKGSSGGGSGNGYKNDISEDKLDSALKAAKGGDIDTVYNKLYERG